MDKVTETNKSAVKTIAVSIIRKNDQQAMVQWDDPTSHVSRRAILSSNDLQEIPKKGFVVDETILSDAVQIGLDFSGLNIKPITREDVINALHSNGIWTKADVLTKRIELLSALSGLTGDILGTLITYTKQLK